MRTQVYSGWADFAVLEETATPFFVADFFPAQEEVLWANEAALKLHWNTVEGLQEFNRDQRAVEDSGFGDGEIYQNVQVRSRIHHAVKTLILGGVQIQRRWTCRPCRVEVADSDVRELTLVSLKLCESSVDASTAETSTTLDKSSVLNSSLADVSGELRMPLNGIIGRQFAAHRAKSFRTRTALSTSRGADECVVVQG